MKHLVGVSVGPGVGVDVHLACLHNANAAGGQSPAAKAAVALVCNAYAPAGHGCSRSSNVAVGASRC